MCTLAFRTYFAGGLGNLARSGKHLAQERRSEMGATNREGGNHRSGDSPSARLRDPHRAHRWRSLRLPFPVSPGVAELAGARATPTFALATRRAKDRRGRTAGCCTTRGGRLRGYQKKNGRWGPKTDGGPTPEGTAPLCLFQPRLQRRLPESQLLAGRKSTASAQI